MSPQTTFSVYFPCLSYGEKGTKWGLPGVYESDNNSGLLSGEGQGGTIAQDLANLYEAGLNISVAANSYVFLPAKVARIKYTTSKGKEAYRMPYETTDEPLVYFVGQGGVNPVLGTNNHRKPGVGI
ncbi:MAG: hypothetical protein ACRC78_18620, partial [Planktothrix sp.]